MAFQVSRVRFRVARPVRRRRFQSRLQDLCDAFRDLVLYREYILPISVKPFCPDFDSVLSIQEMNVDSDMVVHSANRAFQDGVDSQFFGRANRIVRLLLKARDGGASGYPETVYAPARVDEFLGQTVAEIVAFALGALVYERNHC